MQICQDDIEKIPRAGEIMSDEKCECDLRTRLVGDGCRYCNPQYYIDMLEELINEEGLMIREIAAALDDMFEIFDPENSALINGDMERIARAEQVLQRYHEHHG